MDDKRHPFSLQTDEGHGLGDARAFWASIVGPNRLALGSKRTARLNDLNGVLIYKNLGASNTYVFVGVALPITAPINPLNVILGDSNELGTNTSTPAILTSHMSGGGQSVAGFTQLLQPGDQLFCQINDPAFPAGTEQNVVVSAAMI